MSKKQKVHTWEIVNPVYDYSLFVRIGDTRDDTLRWFAKEFKIEEHSSIGDGCNSYATVIHYAPTKSHAIWFRKWDCAIIAHEALHSIRHVMERAQIYLSCSTEEAYAYLLGWTVREITKRLKDAARG